MTKRAWKFDKLMPDKDDVEAELNSGEEYMDWLKNESPDRHHIKNWGEITWAYSAGFIRGMAWAREKRKFLASQEK